MERYERFAGGLAGQWKQQIKGSGRAQITAEGLRLINNNPQRNHYTNAQIDDYQHLHRHEFPWRPPLQFTVRARFSHPSAHENGAVHPLHGTAGFGFWNDPFLMTSWRMPALPRAIWFFYTAPPSNMKLDVETPGWGWKAATIDAAHPSFVALLPFAPLGLPLMHVRPLYRVLWPLAQRAMNVCERLLPVSMVGWHIYTIEWKKHGARFLIDGIPVLCCNRSPHGPLGLVIWKDNQFMQVTPQGHIRHGLVEAEQDEWMEIDWLALEH